MIPASLYIYIYLFVVFVLTRYYSTDYCRFSIQGNNYQRKKTLPIAGLVLTFLLVLVIGNRPIERVLGDTTSYAELYLASRGISFFFDPFAQNFIFDNLFMWCASVGLPVSAFFTIIAFVYFGGIFIACNKLFPQAKMLSYVVYLGAFSTFPYGVNGIKSGAAAAIFLLAIAYRNNRFLSSLLIVLSWGFHHSMLMVIAAYLIVSVLKNPKYYFYIWLFCLIISSLHINFFQFLLASYADEQAQGYLNPDELGNTYITGFRFDFVLYSAVPVWIGYKKYRNQYNSKVYWLLLNLYVLTNSIWMLCMYASYTNRIAYLSWFLYPWVLLYPFVDNKGNFRLSKKRLLAIINGHFAFTLFMTFVYFVRGLS